MLLWKLVHVASMIGVITLWVGPWIIWDLVATGRERRELTDVLDATAAMPGFFFGPGIVHRDEMRRALESLRRSVDEDGSPESE